MFEVPEDKQETKKIRLLIGASAVVVLLVLVGAYFAIQPEDTEVSAAPTVACTPDPVKDLKIINAKMDKDPSGMWAIWSVQIANKSTGCTYANVEYETTYVRSDDTVILANKGTLEGTLAPGDERRFPELRDALFPADAAFYRFKVTGAKVAQ